MDEKFAFSEGGSNFGPNLICFISRNRCFSDCCLPAHQHLIVSGLQVEQLSKTRPANCRLLYVIIIQLSDIAIKYNITESLESITTVWVITAVLILHHIVSLGSRPKVQLTIAVCWALVERRFEDAGNSQDFKGVEHQSGLLETNISLTDRLIGPTSKTCWTTQHLKIKQFLQFRTLYSDLQKLIIHVQSCSSARLSAWPQDLVAAPPVEEHHRPHVAALPRSSPEDLFSLKLYKLKGRHKMDNRSTCSILDFSSH